MDSIEMSKVPTFEPYESRISDLLGSGAFSSVYRFTPSPTNSINADLALDADSLLKDLILNADSQWTSKRQDSRLSRQNSHRTVQTIEDDFEDESAEEEWALKKLSLESLEDPRQTMVAGLEMKKEVMVLSKLPPHPNLIALKGISTDFWSSPEKRFIVLELLVEPLNLALIRWKKEACSGLGRITKKYLTAVPQAQRIRKVAIGISRVLTHLHQHNYIYRDLKPHNIGFDKAGNVKLFDFSTCRKISQEGGRKLSGRVGTIRYMAPENYLAKDYGLAADVWSFGMLLWEICALKRPFEWAKEPYELVMAVSHAHRPSLKKIASATIQDLLEECWQKDPKDRPSLSMIGVALEKETTLALATVGSKKNENERGC